MRSVLQSLSIYKGLSMFVITILQRLIARRVWFNIPIWEGFVRCCAVSFYGFWFFGFLFG
eukprot:jgi/Hompol1/6263/HPOL_000314-RA